MSRWQTIFPRSWQRRYQTWLDRRVPRCSSVQLSQRNVFIFLSRHGLHFLVLDALLWVGATNYQNNLIYALSFLLLAVLFIAILLTFSNVSGLQLRFVDAEPVFAGEVLHARIELSAKSLRQQLVFNWPEQQAVAFTVFPDKPAMLLLPHATQKRGVMRLGRLRLQSVYPLGIVRCWSWLDLAVQAMVYPVPVEADYRFCSRGNAEEGVVADRVVGGDEYFALKPYVTGEQNSRIAWKQFAAGRGLFVREYAEERGGEVMLDFSVMSDLDLELRLSKLCYCACFLHAQGRAFGLILPHQPAIAVDHGEPHLRAVLAALASFTV